MDKVRAAKRIGQGVGIGAATALVAALGWGAFTIFNGAGANADSPTALQTVSASATIGPEADRPERDAQAREAAAQEAAAEAKAAADAAAQLAADQAAAQTAADAAAKEAAESVAPPGPVKCPAGSQANSGDAGNDTSCFPVICFHIVLPDPAHPECVTPFKP